MKLRYDGPLSNFAFSFNLRRYSLNDAGLGAQRRHGDPSVDPDVPPATTAARRRSSAAPRNPVPAALGRCHTTLARVLRELEHRGGFVLCSGYQGSRGNHDACSQRHPPHFRPSLFAQTTICDVASMFATSSTTIPHFLSQMTTDDVASMFATSSTTIPHSLIQMTLDDVASMIAASSTTFRPSFVESNDII